MDMIDSVNKKKYLLRNLRQEDAEDIVQDVFLKLLENKRDIRTESYYYVMVRNEMFQLLKNQKRVREGQTEFAKVVELTKDSKSQYNDLLYKQLKVATLNLFKSISTTAPRQIELLEYLMKEGNEEESAYDIKKDLKFNSYDTAKANVRHIRLKLDKDFRKLISDE